MSQHYSGGNIDWDDFSSYEYIEANYKPLHTIDKHIIEVIKDYLKKNASTNLEAADIGAGPNLYPTFLLLPYASQIELIEYSRQNIEYLKKQLAKVDDFWLDIYHQIYPELRHISQQSLGEQLRKKTIIKKGSIYNLPKEKFDIASMFFCAESITDNNQEFKNAITSFINSIRSRGIVCAAFMENSLGYRVGTIDFPAIKITNEHLKDLFEPFCSELTITRFDEGASRIRKGYTGMLVLVAKKA